ncbi:cytochrome c5 family protein [Phenylobacterium sp.]|uniref:c-type cytochrome n=1 Tax=Phenylobacterium sp. TaxID=1871053 RepID=UPI0035AEF391
MPFAAAGLALAACSPAPAPPADPASLSPKDAHLAELYDGACKACHAAAGSGAPLVQDKAAWAPRWKQGEDVLLDHVVQGYKGMPALGQCAACTPDDFKGLIRFLAGHEGKTR